MTNKGADQTADAHADPHLCCSQTQKIDFLALRPIYKLYIGLDTRKPVFGLATKNRMLYYCMNEV